MPAVAALGALQRWTRTGIFEFLRTLSVTLLITSICLNMIVPFRQRRVLHLGCNGVLAACAVRVAA